MPAYTTVLGLYKPGGGSTGDITPDEPVDIDKLNGNFDLLDAALGFGKWTTTTRPAKPYKGQAGYNSTLDQLERWDGKAWGNITPAYLSSTTLGNTYYTKTQLNAGALDSRYFTQSNLLTDGKLDSKYAGKATETQLNEYIDYSSVLSAAGAISSGWSANRLILKRRAGFLMQIDVSLNRTGGTLTGNLTNARILNLPGGYGSSTYQALSSGPGGNPNALYVQGTGVYLASIAPTTSINTGNEMTICGNWIQS